MSTRARTSSSTSSSSAIASTRRRASAKRCRRCRKSRTTCCSRTSALTDGSGWDFMRHRQGVLDPRPPFSVAMTGYGLAEDRARSEAAGFRHHVDEAVRALRSSRRCSTRPRKLRGGLRPRDRAGGASPRASMRASSSTAAVARRRPGRAHRPWKLGRGPRAPVSRACSAQDLAHVLHVKLGRLARDRWPPTRYARSIAAREACAIDARPVRSVCSARRFALRRSKRDLEGQRGVVEAAVQPMDERGHRRPARRCFRSVRTWWKGTGGGRILGCWHRMRRGVEPRTGAACCKASCC